jgi:hypothetical protein
MTPYSFDCPVHGVFEDLFPMGEAPREAACVECFAWSPRVFGAAMQFTYGKENFHGPTIGERVEQQLKDNPNAVHVGSRWV